MDKETSLVRKHLPWFQRWRSPLITGAVLLLFIPLTATFAPFWTSGFSMPAARLAAAFMGIPCVRVPGGYALASQVLPVSVTTSCSAASFFILLTALVCGVLYGSKGSSRAKMLLWVVPGCYAITLTANTARIVLGWHAGIWARVHLAENFWGAVHLGIGVMVFISFLVAGYGLAWRLHYDRAG